MNFLCEGRGDLVYQCANQKKESIKMMQGKVGVLIPLYNMAEYLERCLISIVGEKSVGEIIIVNDGSTDGGESVCEKLSKRDDRIRVINAQHRGVAAARNLGLKKFTTEYITFVDADDWIEKGMLDDSVQYLKEHQDIDIYINGMCRDDANGIRRKMFNRDDGILIFEKEDALKELFKGDYYRWELCGKIYRHRLFDDFKVDETVIRGEDLDNNWVLFNKANRVICNARPLYHYYYNTGSAVNTPEIMLYSMYEIYGKLLKSACGHLSFVRPYLINLAYREVVVQIKRLCCDGIEKNRKLIVTYQNNLTKFDEGDVESARELDIHGYEKMNFGLSEAIKKYGEIDRLVEVYSQIKNTFADGLNEIDAVCDNIFFYGTGAVANIISNIAKIRMFDWNGYIVSDDALKKSYFCERPVFRVSEIEDKENAVVILALNEKNELEVRDDLYNRGFKYVKSLIKPLKDKYRISDWV